MEEYYKVKVDVEYVFLYLLNSKTKYTSQTPTVNHTIYKIDKTTTPNLNIKIVMLLSFNLKCKPLFLYCSQLMKQQYMLELDRCCQKIEGK